MTIGPFDESTRAPLASILAFNVRKLRCLRGFSQVTAGRYPIARSDGISDEC